MKAESGPFDEQMTENRTTRKGTETKMLKILVTNDDGIDAPGIVKLAACAAKLGTVTVVAPKSQCSGMSHHITLNRPMELKERPDFPVKGVKAYSLDGTPADCVRSVVHGMLDPDAGEKGAGTEAYFKQNPYFPDIVFSGINAGANAGYDIVYSGTVGAAMEAVLYGIPAVCFSQEQAGCDEAADRYLDQIAGELIHRQLPAGQIWNVNFPRVGLNELKGILYDRVPDHWCMYHDYYIEHDGYVTVTDVKRTTGAIGTDIGAILAGYISIGVISNPVV